MGNERVLFIVDTVIEKGIVGKPGMLQEVRKYGDCCRDADVVEFSTETRVLSLRSQLF